MNPVTRFVLAAAIGLGVVTAHRVAAQDASARPASEPISVSDMPPPNVVKGYLQLGFDRLAGFDFVVKEQPTNQKLPRWTGQDQIPDVVKSWAGKKAEIKGFMLPLKLEKGLVTEFLVMRDLSTCCYGAAPSMNHFVVVKVAKGVPSVSEKIVKVSGTFQINTSFDAFGIITGIYQMTGETVVEVGE